MKEVKAYKCDYCGKCSSSKGAMVNHEYYCKNGPNKKHCRTCKWLGMKTEIRKSDALFRDDESHMEPYCEKYERWFSDRPYFEDCEINYGYEGSEHVQPFTCFGYEYKGYAAVEECKFMKELAE